MKIVFLNVWGEEMRDGLADFLKDQTKDTDIFSLQEMTDEVKDRCKDIFLNYTEISDYKYISDHDNFPQTLYIRNNIEVLSSGTLLYESADSGLAIYAEIKVDGSRLYICNVHGTARPNNKLDSPGRLKQSKDIIEFFQNKNVPVIIGGDFNLEPDIESVKIFGRYGYRDLIKEFNIETTRNHFAWDRYPDNKMYYSDYIFLDKKVDLKSFSVIENEVSDHLPLLLEIKI